MEKITTRKKLLSFLKRRKKATSYELYIATNSFRYGARLNELKKEIGISWKYNPTKFLYEFAPDTKEKIKNYLK